MGKLNYSDFDMAFVAHPVSGDISRLTEEAAVKRSVRNIVETDLYERPFQPYLGTPIRSLLFELYTPITSQVIKERVTTSLENFEPRIFLQSVEVKETRDEHALDITVTYSIRNKKDIISQTLTLTRIR